MDADCGLHQGKRQRVCGFCNMSVRKRQMNIYIYFMVDAKSKMEENEFVRVACVCLLVWRPALYNVVHKIYALIAKNKCDDKNLWCTWMLFFATPKILQQMWLALKIAIAQSELRSAALVAVWICAFKDVGILLCTQLETEKRITTSQSCYLWKSAMPFFFLTLISAFNVLITLAGTRSKFSFNYSLRWLPPSMRINFARISLWYRRESICKNPPYVYIGI